jgi:hypothetical protein
VAAALNTGNSRVGATSKILQNGKKAVFVPEIRNALNHYKKGNPDLAIQELGKAAEKLKKEAGKYDMLVASSTTSDSALLNIVRQQDALQMAGIAKLLQLELRGTRITESGGTLMAFGEDIRNIGKKIMKMSGKPGGRTTAIVLDFCNVLINRGQWLHDIAFLGNGKGL